jgi:hypothetical protein
MGEATAYSIAIPPARMKANPELWYEKMAEKILATIMDDTACVDGAILVWRDAAGVMKFERASDPGPWLMQLTDTADVDGLSPGPLARAQFYFDPAQHPVGSTFMLRAVLSATGPSAPAVTMTVQLYNLTDLELVNDSLLTCTNMANPTKFDSSAMTPDVNAGDLKAGARLYEVRIELTAGADENDIGVVGSVWLERS